MCRFCCADLGEECDCGEDEEHCYDPCCFPARVLVSDKENDPERVVWVNGEKKTKPSKRLSCTRHTLPRFVKKLFAKMELQLLNLPHPVRKNGPIKKKLY